MLRIRVCDDEGVICVDSRLIRLRKNVLSWQGLFDVVTLANRLVDLGEGIDVYVGRDAMIELLRFTKFMMERYVGGVFDEDVARRLWRAVGLIGVAMQVVEDPSAGICLDLEKCLNRGEDTDHTQT